MVVDVMLKKGLPLGILNKSHICGNDVFKTEIRVCLTNALCFVLFIIIVENLTRVIGSMYLSNLNMKFSVDALMFSPHPMADYLSTPSFLSLEFLRAPLVPAPIPCRSKYHRYCPPKLLQWL